MKKIEGKLGHLLRLEETVAEIDKNTQNLSRLIKEFEEKIKEFTEKKKQTDEIGQYLVDLGSHVATLDRRLVQIIQEQETLKKQLSAFSSLPVRKKKKKELEKIEFLPL